MIFNDQHINLKITFYKDYSKIKLTGNVKNPGQYKNIVIMAPNPIDRMSNYSGSGLPFPNNEIAFQNTPNREDITGSGVINTDFYYPKYEKTLSYKDSKFKNIIKNKNLKISKKDLAGLSFNEVKKII